MKNILFFSILAGALGASPALGQTGGPRQPEGHVLASEEPRSGEEGGADFDAAGVLDRTVTAMRIRLLVKTWPVSPESTIACKPKDQAETQDRERGEDGECPASTEERWKEAKSFLNASTLAAEFALNPGDVDTLAIPTDEQLRSALAILEQNYPRTLDAAPQTPTGAGLVRSAGDLSYTIFRPAGSDLATEPGAGGAGVSFQQALIEGTTAFLLDRARADLARAGLERFQNDVRASDLRDAFPQTVSLGGFTGAGSDAYRDPRLYLLALQAALADDFEGLPTYVSSSLQGTNALGLRAYQWELAHRSLDLVADVQRGTHPLLALSTFSAQELDEASPALNRRLLELYALSSALYAGAATDEGRAYDTGQVLRTLDGRRLFAIFLTQETLRAACRQEACPDSLKTWKGVKGEVDATEARVIALRQTLNEIVAEVTSLRKSFNQIRAANPGQAAEIYAGYIAVVTRAVRQILVATQGERPEALEFRALAEVERVLAIREAVVRRDYPGAVSHAMPYLVLIAESAGGASGRELADALDGTLALLESRHVSSDTTRPIAQAKRYLQYAGTMASSAHEASENRKTLLDTLRGKSAVGKVCPRGSGTEMICIDLDELARLADDAVAAWDSVRVVTGAGAANRVDTIEKGRAALETARTRIGAAYDAELAYGEQLGRTVTLAAREAVSGEAIRDAAKDIRNELQDVVSGTRVGQLFVAAAAMVGSTSSDDVYQALVVYSAPPGSFRDRRWIRPARQSGRRGRAFSMALGAYPGVSAGREWVSDSLGAHIGASIPIGVEVTWALKKTKLLPGVRSIGVFASPVNLGTYADYRFGSRKVPVDTTGIGGAANRNVENEPTVSLGQVFSPSVYGVFGMSRDLPISIGVGSSYVPAFRTIEGTEERRSAWRISVFVAADIPLWIFQ